MIGCLVAWKCLVACLFFESSQQPTCPQVRQRRRCTQVSPVFKQSSHPLALGVTSRIWSRWLHCCAICFCSPSLMLLEDDASHVGEGILQQKELRLHMLSKVPCCPAIRGPENTEGCLLCEDVQEELSVGRIILNKQNKRWEGPPLGGKSPISWSMQHLLFISFPIFSDTKSRVEAFRREPCPSP